MFLHPADPFVVHFDPPLAGAESGPLASLTVAVKDLFDIGGCKTGAGNPDWHADHAPAATDAAAVAILRTAGARIVGKAMTDELAYSLAGGNDHYGMPLNGGAPDRTPGGSSSGSASAVSQGLADVGLGTDTGGSVRIPACFCGLFGLRPSHGRIPLAGVVPLAPRFDTVGWMTRDLATLARAGAPLLGDDAQPSGTPKFAIAQSLFRSLSAQAQDALAPLLTKIEATDVDLSPALLAEGAEAYRILQGRDAWRAQGPWIERRQPLLGTAVGERFALAARMSEAEEQEAELVRATVIAVTPFIHDPDTILVLPTAPGPAPHRDASPEEVAASRGKLMALTCLAGLTGAPQVHLPLAQLEGAPFGLSLMAAPGRDRMLLAAAEKVCQ